jgi:hypothetical protein
MQKSEITRAWLGKNVSLDFEEVLVPDLANRAALFGKKISLGREAQGYSQKVLAELGSRLSGRHL